MSAGGGGGGRRLPIYVDIILTGQGPAIAGINSVSASFSNLNRGAAGAAGPLNQAQRALTQTSTAATQASTGLTSTAKAAQTSGTALTGVNRGASTASQGMRQLSTGSTQAASGLSQLTTSANTTGQAVGNMNRQMSRGSALRGAFSSEMKGIAFAAIGTFGAVNEAAFMVGTYTDALNKKNAVQAEVTALEEAGQKGTKEYKSAVDDLQKSQRALNFTYRIMSQSIFDIVSFTGIMGTQIASTAAKYKELRTGVDAAAKSTQALNAVQLVSNATQAGQVTTLGRFTNTAKTAGVATTGLAAATVAGAGAFQKITVPLGRTEGAVKKVGDAMILSGTAATTASSGFMKFARIAGPIALAIGAIVAAVVLLYKNFMGIRDAARGFVDWITEITSTVPGAAGAIQALVGAYKYLEGAVVGIIAKIPVLNDMLGIHEQAAKKAGGATAVVSEEVTKHNEAMAELSPSIQAVAKAWGVYEASTFSAGAAGQALVAGLDDLQKTTDEARAGAIELATANGVTLHDALAMSDTDLQNWLLSAGELGPTAEMAAEQAEQAATDMADAWQESFDKISEAQSAWGETMHSASETIWKEMGGEMKVGLNDIKQDVQGGFGFNEDFWNKVFPQQIASNVFEKNFDLSELIDDMKDTIDRAVDKGFIEEEDAERWFEPLMDYMENKLPDDSEAAIGKLVGEMPGLMAELKPSLINGVIEVGKDAKTAVDSNIVQPIVAGLKGLDEGTSGLQFGDNILGIVRQSLPALQSLGTQGEALAGVFQGILDSSLPMYDTTEEKVQAVIDILGQMGMGFDDLVLGVNEDGDDIADVMDNQILNAASAMRIGILQAFADVAEAAGDTTMFDKLTEKIKQLIGGFEEIPQKVEPKIHGLNQSLWNMLTPMEQAVYLVEGTLPDGLTKSSDSANALEAATFSVGEEIQTFDEILADWDGTAGEATKSANDLADALLKLGKITPAEHEADLLYNTTGEIDPSKAYDFSADLDSLLGPEDEVAGENPLTKQLTDTITEALNALPTIVTELVNTVAPKIGKALYELFTTKIVPQVSKAATGLFNIVSGYISSVDWGNVWLQTQNAIVDSAKWLYDAFTTKLVPLITTAVTGLANIIGGYLASVNWGEIGLQAQNAIVDSAKWLYDAFTTRLVPLITTAVTGLANIVGGFLASINWGEIGLQAQNAIVDSAKWLYDAFTTKLVPWLTKIVTDLGSLVGGYLASVNWGEVGLQAQNAIVDSAKWLYDAFTTKLVPWLSKIMTDLGGLVGGYLASVNWGEVGLQAQNAIAASGKWLLDAFTTKLAPTIFKAATDLGNMIGGYLGAIDWAAALGSFGAGVGQLIVDAMILKGQVQAAINTFVGITLPGYITTAASGLPGKIGAALGTGLGGLDAAIVGALANATTDLPNKFRVFIADSQKNIDAIRQGFIDLFSQSGAKPTGQQLTDAISTQVAGFNDAFNKAFGEAFSAGGGNEASDQLNKNVNEIGAAITKWLTDGTTTGLRDFVSSIDKSFTDFQAMASEFGQQFTGVDVGAIGDGIYNMLTAGWNDAWTSFTNFLSGKATDIQGIIRGLFTGGGTDQDYLTPTSLEDLPGQGTTKKPDYDQTRRGQYYSDEGGGTFKDLPMAAEGVDFTDIQNKYLELRDFINTVLGEINLAWTDHINTITGLINGMLGPVLVSAATGYVAFSQGVTATIATMELAWTNHLVNNGAQITAFITGPLTMLSQAYTLFQTNVATIIAAMELAWTNHLVNNGAQITAFITGPLTLLSQAYTLYQTNVIPILAAMELAWTNHLVNNGAQITAFITGPLTLLSQAYILFQQNVPLILAQMTQSWFDHGTAVTSVYNESIMPAINAYGVTGMAGLAANVFLFLATANDNWINHGTAVTDAVNGAILGAIATYTDAGNQLASDIHSSLENANQNWAAHSSHVEGIASEIADHVSQLASDIASSMSDIVGSMGEAESAATDLKAAIDALEDKTITVTTIFRTVGSPGGGGGVQQAAHGFQGVVAQPTRFLVGEGSQPEFVSVTPLTGRNADGNQGIRGFFDKMQPMDDQTLRRAGTGGIGGSRSGLKRPDINPGDVRRKTTLNDYFEDVLTYTEEKEYRKLLKKLKKKKWKPSKLNDKDEDRLGELEDKILEARKSQIDTIKSAMAQVQRQIGLTTDLKSEEELEKWVSTVMPPLATAPISMQASAVKAMSIRGRYDYHRDAMKAGRRADLEWLDGEFDRQKRVAEELEDRRLKEEEEKDDWIEEHGTKKQKKKLKKKRKKQKEEQRRKLLLSRNEARDFAYNYSIQKYYEKLAQPVPAPTTIPVPGEEPGVGDNATRPTDEIFGRRGFHGTVSKRTSFTAGEYGKRERVDITPMGSQTQGGGAGDDIRKEVRHFITGILGGGAGGTGTGNNTIKRETIVVQNNQPIELKINEQVLMTFINRALHKTLSSKR